MNKASFPAEVMSGILNVISTLRGSPAHSAAKYISSTLVVRATRPIYGPKGKKRVSKGGNFQVTLVVGKPNARQREFIKACKKAKEPFPVKKVQIKMPPHTKI